MDISKLKKLKQSELNVLEVLWNENQPLMASEIVEKGRLITSTVQVALRSLLKKDIIGVADIVVNVTALSRKYFPNITKTEYEDQILAMDFKRIINKGKSSPSFVTALLSQSDLNSANAEIDALQELINNYRVELKKKEDS